MTPENCPSCGKPLSPAAVLCVQCGYDLRSGQKLKTEVVVRPDEPDVGPSSQQASLETRWHDDRSGPKAISDGAAGADEPSAERPRRRVSRETRWPTWIFFVTVVPVSAWVGLGAGNLLLSRPIGALLGLVVGAALGIVTGRSAVSRGVRWPETLFFLAAVLVGNLVGFLAGAAFLSSMSGGAIGLVAGTAVALAIGMVVVYGDLESAHDLMRIVLWTLVIGLVLMVFWLVSFLASMFS